MVAWLLELAAGVGLVVAGFGLWALPTDTPVIGRPPVVFGWLLIALGVLIVVASTFARIRVRMQGQQRFVAGATRPYAALRQIRRDLQDAEGKIAQSIQDGTYWPGGRNWKIRRKTWEATKMALMHEPGLTSALAAIEDAYVNLDNVVVYRSRQITGRTPVKPGDNLEAVLVSIRKALTQVQAKLSVWDTDAKTDGTSAMEQTAAMVRRLFSVLVKPNYADVAARFSVAPRTEEISSDPYRALVVTWRDEQLANFQYKAWMFRLKYRVENQTDRPIGVLHVSFQGPPVAMTTPEIDAERQRIQAELGVPPKVIPPNGTVDRWYLGEFAWNPDLGEPGYEIRLKANNGGHEYGFRRFANPKREIKP